MNLDAYTIFITGISLNIILILYLTAMWKNHRREVNGITSFITGLVFMTIGSFLIISNFSEFFSIVISNTFLLTGILFFTICFHRFISTVPGKNRITAYILLTIIVFVEQIIFTLYFPNLTARIILLSFIILILLSDLLITLIQYRKISSYPGKMLFTSFAIVFLFYLLRIFFTLSTQPTGKFVELNGLHAIPLLIWVVVSCTWPIGFALLVTNKLKRVEEEQNREKTLLLRELHHRTRNNMQVINSIILLKRLETDSDEVKKCLLEFENKLETISRVHKNLDYSTNLSYVNIKDYVNELIQFLLSNLSLDITKTHVVTNIENMMLLFDVAIPVGLIFNELFALLAKNNKAQKKRNIDIHLSKDDNTINIHFHDSIEYELTDLSVPQSSDLSLVINIVEKQLAGKIRINTINKFECDIKFENILYNQRI